MSTKSKSTSAKGGDRKHPARPFEPEVLKRAEEIAERYQVLVSFEDGESYGRGWDPPGARPDGKPPAARYAPPRDAMKSPAAPMTEDGEPPPPPASEGQRTEQVNVRWPSD